MDLLDPLPIQQAVLGFAMLHDAPRQYSLMTCRAMARAASETPYGATRWTH